MIRLKLPVDIEAHYPEAIQIYGQITRLGNFQSILGWADILDQAIILSTVHLVGYNGTYFPAVVI